MIHIKNETKDSYNKRIHKAYIALLKYKIFYMRIH